MHFIIGYKNLSKIKKLLLLNSSNNTDGKTENILVSTEKNTINFYTNNGFNSAKFILNDENNKIFKENKIFINANIFLSLINNLKDCEKIEFVSRENNLLEISSNNFSCNLVCVEENNYVFENYEITDDFKHIEFKYSDLKTINNRFKDFCKQINTSINKNTLLTNINLKTSPDNKKLFALITDSYKVVFGQFDHLGTPFEINISPSTLNNIVSLFSDCECIDFYYHNNTFIVKNQEVIYKSSIFVGNYPNFLDWFNIEPKYSFEIPKITLLSALDRNLLFSTIFLKSTKFKLFNDKLLVEYKDSERGFSKEEISINRLVGDDVQFSLNSSYLKQLIRNIDDETLIFNLTDELKPIVVFGKSKDLNFKQIVIPCKN